MQVFLPYKSYISSVRVLDNKRLGKQRLEADQILKIIRGEYSAWKNHPIVRMFRGYEESLILYKNCCMFEWQARGYKNIKLQFQYVEAYENIQHPPWLGREDIHSSHRAALLYKNFEWYSKFGWEEEPKLQYIWA